MDDADTNNDVMLQKTKEITSSDVTSSDERSPSEAPENVHDPVPDTRLYVPNNEDLEVHIKRDSDRYFCYSKHPGQDWFHLLLQGEVYVTRQHEKYCLRCALRLGFLTFDRLFWQHRVPRKRDPL